MYVNHRPAAAGCFFSLYQLEGMRLVREDRPITDGKCVNLGLTHGKKERSQGNARGVRLTSHPQNYRRTKIATKPKIRGTQKRHGGLGSVVAQIGGRI